MISIKGRDRIISYIYLIYKRFQENRLKGRSEMNAVKLLRTESKLLSLRYHRGGPGSFSARKALSSQTDYESWIYFYGRSDLPALVSASWGVEAN